MDIYAFRVGSSENPRGVEVFLTRENAEIRKNTLNVDTGTIRATTLADADAAWEQIRKGTLPKGW